MGLTQSTLSLLGEWGASVWLPAVVTAAIAYFCGCFNGAVIVSKYILRDDVRTHGSGNAGLTNFYRTFGGPLTFVVILTDVLKAIVAVLVGVWLTGQLLPIPDQAAQQTAAAMAEYWAGLFCLLGHMFPCHVPVQGGQGHPLRRHHRHHDRLAGGPGGVGGLPDFGHPHPVCLPGLQLRQALPCPSSPGSSIRIRLILILSIIIGGLILFKHRTNLQRLAGGQRVQIYIPSNGKVRYWP